MGVVLDGGGGRGEGGREEVEGDGGREEGFGFRLQFRDLRADGCFFWFVGFGVCRVRGCLWVWFSFGERGKGRLGGFDGFGRFGDLFLKFWEGGG